MARLPTKGSYWTLTILFLASCGQLPGYRVDPVTATFQQTSTTVNDKIDLLFIIDNSQSMAANQTALADSFSTFMTQFTQRNLDFHIAVIATDMISNASYWANSSSWQSLYGPSAYANFINSGPEVFWLTEIPRRELPMI